MNYKEILISSIKNLDLIFVYPVSTELEADSGKYIGINVLYNNKKDKIDLKYNEDGFQKYVKRILDRYEKEKDARRIILLGELTERLIKESSFAILDEEKSLGSQKIGVPSFNTSNKNIKIMIPYLKEALKTIMFVYKNYELLNIDEIDGYGRKYIAKYSVGPVKKQIPMILYQNQDDNLNFEIGAIDGVVEKIKGTIAYNGAKVQIDWSSKEDYTVGSLTFDPIKGISERKVDYITNIVYYEDGKETIIEEDIEKILFYTKLCGIEDIDEKRVLKIDDNSYLLSEEKTKTEAKDKTESEKESESESELLITTTGLQIYLEKEEARIKYTNKTSVSKYDNQFNNALEKEIEDITLKKIEIDDKPYILMEKKYINDVLQPSYSYEVLELEDQTNIDLRKPFNVSRRYYVEDEVRTIESVKQYVREYKGGNK